MIYFKQWLTFLNNYLSGFLIQYHMLFKKIIQSTDTNTEKCRGCCSAPQIPPSGWGTHSFSNCQNLTAEDSHLIPTLGILPSTELPQLRLRPLPVKLKNQKPWVYFEGPPNTRALWGGLRPQWEPLLLSSLHHRGCSQHSPINLLVSLHLRVSFPQRSWIKQSKRYMGKALMWCSLGKLLL